MLNRKQIWGRDPEMLAIVSACDLDARRAAIVALRQSGQVTRDDVRRLRREVFADGCVTRDEADALFALDMSKCERDAEWTAFFVEAILDHIVWQARPTGVVNESQAEWLIDRADMAKSISAFAVLVSVLAEAHRTPMWFLAAVKARAAQGWPGLDAALAAAVEEAATAAEASAA
jgi:hypothetical protein